ncbi:MAG: toxin-antitoxin system HicB family antitoxin [Planctomycetota bacterium]|jgi:predicted HicB family RNase H-like nuclease|nr:toxin-antitoxin system HicB family antitoxin [Planctomycetaceae bacterium]
MSHDFNNGLSNPATLAPEAMDKTGVAAGEKLAADMVVFNSVAQELRAKHCQSAKFEDRCHWVQQVAAELFGVAPTWTAFYRETLGVDGVAHRIFSESEEYRNYESSDCHSKVLEMLTVLRCKDVSDCDPTEVQKMITIRIPKSLHDRICAEANELDVSVNKLAITRMLQRVDMSMLPLSNQKRRGRRPGAAYHKQTAEQAAAAQGMQATPAS